MPPRLTIGYSTTAARVAGMVPPPSDPAARVLVVVQVADGDPPDWRSTLPAPLAARPDVGWLEQPGRGVTRSRNLVLDSTTTPYLLFGDDDVAFCPDGVRAAVRLLDDDPRANLVLGAASDEQGRPRKRYPAVVEPLNLRNSAKAATYEMLVRVDAVRALGVRFDERFGAGATHYLGDEYIFCADVLRAGGRGLHGPIVLARHPGDSSGARWGTAADRRARAAVFDRVFGRLAPAARLVFGLRRLRRLGGVTGVLRFAAGR